MDTLTLIGMAQRGDKDAREQIVTENVGLVYGIVKRFTGRGIEVEDLVQIGSIGLIKAIDKFDLSFNVKFSTYAVPMIIGEIRRYMRDNGMVKVSRSLKENAFKLKNAARVLEQKLGREATIYEMAEMADISKEDAVIALEATEEVESIYKTVYQNDGSEIYLADQLACSDSSRTDFDNGVFCPGTAGGGRNYAGAVEDIEKEKLLNNILLNQLISELEDEERSIIAKRYFEEKTQSEVAKEMGISQVQISRIEKKILTKMRRRLT